ncbi:hypothetical protein FBUS_10813 [Fasciolopsis buskii]|uniref:Uncharacterized protein n=1 Tax=Fasciolopsis buskii TaxID=27845 RepID=A0A8E0RTY6_9TREM|nr:hypothetical protein FBUS_10813 [Fasciolopsis buski]
MFCDFDLIPGLDVAHTSYGYSYYTKYDTKSRISEACLQSAGDDIVYLLRRVAYGKNLASTEKLKVSEAPSSDIEVRNVYLSSHEIDIYLAINLCHQCDQGIFDLTSSEFG